MFILFKKPIFALCLDKMHLGYFGRVNPQGMSLCFYYLCSTKYDCETKNRTYRFPDDYGGVICPQPGTYV